jgi:hypothetical protein
MPQPFRIAPALPVGSYKTYQIRQPLNTHFRKATCAEVECPPHLKGWATRVPVISEQADYIMNKSGRKFKRVVEDGMAVFTFYPGQSCFGEHVISLQRPQLFLVKDGDWRGNPSGRSRQHTRAADWVDDFATHQADLADKLEKG